MPKPLSPDALSELERLLADATPGPYWVKERGCEACGHDVKPLEAGMRGLLDRKADAAYIVALLNAAPELLRVYRAAQGGLAARTYREARIVSLETEAGRLRGEYRRGLEDALTACSETEDELKRNFKLWGPDQAADESGGALQCQTAIEALIGAVDDA